MASGPLVVVTGNINNKNTLIRIEFQMCIAPDIVFQNSYEPVIQDVRPSASVTS